MSQDWATSFSIDPFILPGVKSESSTRKAVARAKKSTASTRVSGVSPRVAEEVLAADEDHTLRKCLGAICRQDQSALGNFYDLTVGRVYGVALRIVRHADLAEEVV